MLAENVRTESFADAIAKTFDGGHPCHLCHAVQKGKSQEKKSASQVASGKVDLMCATRALVMIPPHKDLSFAGESRSACAEAPTPLLPPPRSELA